jgi:Ser/Thr protein kinase RdoA (MazF antagonist)
LRPDEVTLTLIKSRDEETYLKDDKGEYWRTFEYLEGTTAYDVCPNPDVARESAAILGRFQRCLFDLDPSGVKDTIPDFHHGGKRFEAFAEAVRADVKGRASSCQKEIAFALERREFGRILIDSLTSGAIHRRVCHNDMKLNNVLFDAAGERAVCLLDLDTCMPGTVLFDFGDLARNTAVPSAEDEQDFTKVSLDMGLYHAICEGYLGEVGTLLSPREVELMSVAPRVLALTLGVRFLTDYLLGDTYFRVHRPNHNLERARTQFYLVSLMEELESEMAHVVSGLTARL